MNSMQEAIKLINEEMLNTHRGLFTHNSKSFIMCYQGYDDLTVDTQTREDLNLARRLLALIWCAFFRIKILEEVLPTRSTDTYYHSFGKLIQELNDQTEKLINRIPEIVPS